MIARIIRFFLCYFIIFPWVTVAQPVIHSVNIFDQETLYAIAYSDLANEQSNQIAILFAQSNYSELGTQTEQLLTDVAMQLPIKERLLKEIALGLRNEPQTIQGEVILGHLSDYQEQVYVTDEHTYFLVSMVAFNVASTARGTLISWQWQDHIAQGLDDMSQMDLSLIETFQIADEVKRKAYLEAVARVSKNVLTTFWQQAKQQEITEVNALLFSHMATRMQDQAILLTAFKWLNKSQQLELLDNISQQMATQQQFSVYQSLIADNYLSSNVFYRIGKLAEENHNALLFLLQQLDIKSYRSKVLPVLSNIKSQQAQQWLNDELLLMEDNEIKSKLQLTLEQVIGVE